MLVALRTSRKLNNCFMHQHDYMINEACKKYGELKRCVSQVQMRAALASFVLLKLPKSFIA